MAENSSEKKKGLGNLLDTLNGLIELVDKLDERGDQGVTRNGEFETQSGLKGKYGVKFKTAGGSGGGTSHEEETDSVVEKAPPHELVPREPPIDVLEENDDVRIIAEIPGVSEESIRWSTNGSQLTLSASAGDRKYQKSLKLPFSVAPDPSEKSYINGMFSAVFPRANEEQREAS